MTGFRSGFAAVVGRPNVGKSTLVNAMVGEKVTITSSWPNTTRGAPRGVVNRPGAQLVLVDTPGLHRPKTALGSRLNETASASLSDLDCVVAVLDATAPIGPGDRMVLERALAAVGPAGAPESVGEGNEGSKARPAEAPVAGPFVAVVVNKVDRVGRGGAVTRLAEAADTVGGLAADAGSGAGQGGGPAVEYFATSASTGEGVGTLLDTVCDRLPEGPAFYPDGMLRDVPDAAWVAELVREELLDRVRDELPHSIACRVTDWDWPRVRCEIVVERDSQKGIVIGKDGARLKEVGTAVRRQLPDGAYLELFVRVEKHWQQRDDALDRLGL